MSDFDDNNCPLTDQTLADLAACVDKHPCGKSSYCPDDESRIRFALHAGAKKMIAELQRHRSAHAASEERVRAVVREAVLDAAGKVVGCKGSNIDADTDTWKHCDAIATRAAKQLATAAVGLGEDERHLLEIIGRDIMEFGIGHAEPDMDDADEDQLCDLRDKCKALVDRLLSKP